MRDCRRDIVESSGWLLCDGNKPGVTPSSSGFGSSEGNGILGNIPALRNSLPKGVSSVPIYHTLQVRRICSFKYRHTIVENSPRRFEQRSARSVSMFSFLLPMALGMTTSPGRRSPKFIFVDPSSSSKMKQFRARGYMESEGNISFMTALNSARMDVKESEREHEAMPMTPRGNEDGRNIERLKWLGGGGWLG